MMRNKPDKPGEEHCFSHFLLGNLLQQLLLQGLPIVVCLAGFAQSNNDYGYYPSVTPGIQPSAPKYTPDYVPKFDPQFWQAKAVPQTLQAGTVLTGTLQDQVSSRSSKVGDIFAILLADGYSEAGKQLLPRDTKIVGAVTQVISSRQVRGGQPGRVEISLQTLVLPDGRSTPIYAFIERNPSLEFQEDPRKDKKGLPLGDYARSLRSAGSSLVNSVSGRAVGMPLYNRGRTGHEFLMEVGQVLPLRLNRGIDLALLFKQPLPTTPEFNNQAPPSSAQRPGYQPVPGLVEPEPAPPIQRGLAPAGIAGPGSYNQTQPLDEQDEFSPTRAGGGEPSRSGAEEPF